MTKENHAKAEEILTDVVGVSREEMHFEDALNRHVPVAYVLEAMEAYAAHRDQKAVKKALEMVCTRIDGEQFTHVTGDTSRVYNQAIFDMVAIITDLEPSILSLLNNDKV